MSFDWTGKIAIVTGGGSGLGRDSSFSLANSGATVVIADIDRASGERVVGEIKQLQRETTFIELDVADSHEVNEMARSVIECFGGINILVNSAGITRRLPPLDFPEEDFDRIIAVNLKGTFLCCQAAARQMARQVGAKSST